VARDFAMTRNNNNTTIENENVERSRIAAATVESILPNSPRIRSKRDLERIRQVAGSKNHKHDNQDESGSSCVQELKQVIEEENWTAEELSTPHPDGKAVLHIAAWYGSLDILKFLLEFGCNVNCLATGAYTYGKTPIFFAVTKCRNDAVQLLLDYGAKVCIVNNKGQSVLSLASTHLRPELIQLIQQTEAKEGYAFQNYRALHSDGLVYGDLDPRFLERPLEPSDHVTEFAINPTTQEIRRGNFARNNPSRGQNKKKKQQLRNKKKTPPPQPTAQEVQDYEQVWERLHQTIQICWQSTYDDEKNKDAPAILETQPITTTLGEIELGRLLLCIIQFWEKQRYSWLPETAKRVRDLLSNKLQLSLHDERLHVMFGRAMDSLLTKDEQNSGNSSKYSTATHSKSIARQQALLEKLVTLVLDNNDTDNDENASSDDDDDTNKKHSRQNRAAGVGPNNHPSLHGLTVSQQLRRWQEAWEAAHAQFASYHTCHPRSVLQNPHRHATHLSLPCPPQWVDSSEALKNLKHALTRYFKGNARRESCSLVALDTEWCTAAAVADDDDNHGGGGRIQVATLQIAFFTTNYEEEGEKESEILHAWVIDLLPKSSSSEPSDSPSFEQEAAEFIHWLFHQDEGNLCLLWFAMGHDMPKLCAFVRDNTTVKTLLPVRNCLDLQLILTEQMRKQQCTNYNNRGGNHASCDTNIASSFNPSHLPGLKTCSEFYLSAPSRHDHRHQDHNSGTTSSSSWALSKEQQCSDWARRPLSMAQLEYAGLDAAVLLILLAVLENPSLQI
jgi:hypothetical protein